MTQAHKTPGALVEFKPLDPRETGAEDVFGRWMGLVLEVVEEYPRGHVVVIDYHTRELLGGPPPAGHKACGFHAERFQTISPERRRAIERKRKPGPG